MEFCDCLSGGNLVLTKMKTVFLMPETYFLTKYVPTLKSNCNVKIIRCTTTSWHWTAIQSSLKNVPNGQWVYRLIPLMYRYLMST